MKLPSPQRGNFASFGFIRSANAGSNKVAAGATSGHLPCLSFCSQRHRGVGSAQPMASCATNLEGDRTMITLKQLRLMTAFAVATFVGLAGCASPTVDDEAVDDKAVDVTEEAGETNPAYRVSGASCATGVATGTYGIWYNTYATPKKQDHGAAPTSSECQSWCGSCGFKPSRSGLSLSNLSSNNTFTCRCGR